MSRFIDRVAKSIAGVTAVALLALPAAAAYEGVGRTATPAEIKAWDIDVRPDFKGLPPGSGSVEKGQHVWEAKCASCHGVFAESNEVFPPLVGGITAEDIKTGRVKALTEPDVARTTIMKVPTVSTLWDYINRAMPWNAPKTLTTEEVYAVLAYLLNLGDILPADFVLSDRNIAEVQQRMPNRNGMRRDHGLWDIDGKPDVKNVACMKDCPTEVKIASALPEHARGAHGDLADQNRLVGPVRGAPSGEEGSAQGKAARADIPVAQLAKQQGCLSCHNVEKRIVGPSFKEVAAKYQGQGDAEEKLAGKVRRGGSGTWGPIPMPPHPDMREADIRALVRWILGGAG